MDESVTPLGNLQIYLVADSDDLGIFCLYNLYSFIHLL